MLIIKEPNSLLFSILRAVPHSLRCHLLYYATHVEYSGPYGTGNSYNYTQYASIDITLGFYIALTHPNDFNTLDHKTKQAIYADNVACIELITQRGCYIQGLTNNLLLTTNFDAPPGTHGAEFEGVTCEQPQAFKQTMMNQCEIKKPAAELLRMLNIFSYGERKEANELKRELFKRQGVKY